jgi:hypothetical protein
VTPYIEMFGAGGVRCDKGQVDLGLHDVDSSILAFSAASLRRCSAILSDRKSIPLVFLAEGVGQIVDQAQIEILTAQMGVTVGGLDLENPVPDFENRDIEGTAAEIENGDFRSVFPSRP